MPTPGRVPGWDRISKAAGVLCLAPMSVLLILGGPLSVHAVTAAELITIVFSLTFWTALLGAPQIVLLVPILLSGRRELRLLFLAISTAMAATIGVIIASGDTGVGSIMLEGLPILTLQLAGGAAGAAIVGSLVLWLGNRLCRWQHG